MSDDDREWDARKTDPGSHRRTCQNPACPNGYNFRTANPRARYCSEECQRSAQNARNYTRRIERSYRRKKTPEERALTAAGLFKKRCHNQNCPNGGEFISRYRRQLYCDAGCQRAAQNARNYRRRKEKEHEKKD